MKSQAVQGRRICVVRECGSVFVVHSLYELSQIVLHACFFEKMEDRMLLRYKSFFKVTVHVFKPL